MRFRTIMFSAVCFSFLWAITPVMAHHSFSAEYDRNKPITLTGKVTKVEWMNPHTFFYIDVKDEKAGTVTNWAIEMGSPNGLIRLGWSRNSMKVDDLVTVEGTVAKDGSKLANARSVLLTNTGKKLFAGSSEGNTP